MKRLFLCVLITLSAYGSDAELKEMIASAEPQCAEQSATQFSFENAQSAFSSRASLSLVIFAEPAKCAAEKTVVIFTAVDKPTHQVTHTKIHPLIAEAEQHRKNAEMFKELGDYDKSCVAYELAACAYLGLMRTGNAVRADVEHCAEKIETYSKGLLFEQQLLDRAKKSTAFIKEQLQLLSPQQVPYKPASHQPPLLGRPTY